MSSMRPPKALAPMNTATSPRRPVRASGKASAAKAIKCTSLSLPSGTGGGASRGQSMAILRVIAKKAVRGMSRYLRMECALAAALGESKRWDLTLKVAPALARVTHPAYEIPPQDYPVHSARLSI
jgi:hypothetical protein